MDNDKMQQLPLRQSLLAEQMSTMMTADERYPMTSNTMPFNNRISSGEHNSSGNRYSSVTRTEEQDRVKINTVFQKA